MSLVAMLTTVKGSELPSSVAASLQLIREPWGSQSTASVRPRRCSTIARLTADVVFPVPPFVDTSASLIGRSLPDTWPDRNPAEIAEYDAIGTACPHRTPVFRQQRQLRLVVGNGETLPAMDADCPEHLLAREPAQPFEGEGPFALWHFSEDPSLGRFRPQVPITNPQIKPLVWAVDTRHSPTFWFPRDCPRGCIWPSSATTPEDRERFFGQSGADRVHVIEADWLGRMQVCR